jgi:hypothetical protein
MLIKKEIIALVEQKLDKKVKDFTKTTTGVSSDTYKISIENAEDFYFKQGNSNYKIQVQLKKQLDSLGVKTPQIIAHDHLWVIEKAVNGVKLDIDNRDLTNRILRTFGERLALVHKIKTTQYGPLVTPNKGKYKTYAKYFERLQYLIHRKYSKMLNAFINNQHDTCLNHGDVSQGHIYIDSNGDFASLIDWDDVVSAPREFDLSELLVNLEYDKEYWNSFMEGYAKHFDYIDINNKDLLLSALLQNYESYYWYLAVGKNNPEKLERDKQRIEELEFKIDKW